MATEGRAKEWLSRNILYPQKAYISGFSPGRMPEILAAYAESECKGLASRVEELEAALREIYECGSISYAEIVAKRALAQPSGNTPGKEK